MFPFRKSKIVNSLLTTLFSHTICTLWIGGAIGAKLEEFKMYNQIKGNFT